MDLDVLVFGERLHNSHQMVLGDLVRGADFLCRDDPFAVCSQINQYAKRVIGT